MLFNISLKQKVKFLVPEIYISYNQKFTSAKAASSLAFQ